MISQKTAADIWNAYRELEAAHKLLENMAKASTSWGRPDPLAPTIRDSFGRLQHFQLGIPMGDSGHTLYNVSPPLAEACIRAHIAHKQAELVELRERARIELQAGEVVK